MTTADRFTVITTPAVVSIVRANSAAALTNAASVAFTVTFNESVLNVSAASFALTTTGAVSGASIASVTGSGSVYTVTVATGTGDGTLRLDVQATTTIQDSAGNHLPAAATPAASRTRSTTRRPRCSRSRWPARLTNAASVGYTVTFSEAVTGVNVGDFSLVAAGVSGAAIKSVTGSGAVYTVTVNTGAGQRHAARGRESRHDGPGPRRQPPARHRVQRRPVVHHRQDGADGRHRAGVAQPAQHGRRLDDHHVQQGGPRLRPRQLALKTSGGSNLLTASQTLTTSDHITWVLGNLAGLTDPTHRLVTFTLSLSAAGVTDAAGNALAGGASTSFVVLDPALDGSRARR